MKHAAVIGGTGMLAGVTRNLARQVDAVAVVARRLARIEALQLSNVRGLPLDYRKRGALTHALGVAARVHGPLDLVVAWIHGDSAQGHAEVCASLAPPARYVRVLGHAAGAPDAAVPDIRLPGVSVQDVVLGFVVERTASRWLTHAEICQGVMSAIDTGRPRTVVGQIEPWCARPL